MATKLGTLTLDLLVRLGKFTEPLKQAEGQLKGSLTKMKGFIASYGAIAATAVAGATTAIIAMADTMAKHNAELERFAYLSQTSVAEFQKMAVGAQMMGIEAEKLSDIMKDWNERFGDFLTAGSGPLVDFMEQVAVKTEKGADGAMKLAKELSKLSGPESMGLFVKKMEEANLSQDQMSFLMESMASDSTLLLPLLKNNAEGMRLWGEAAERAGIIMDEKTLKASRELQVQTKMLDMQYEGLKKRVLSQVIPALVDISEAMLDGDEKARGMADAGKVLADSLRGVAAIALGVWAALNMVANGIAGVTNQALDSYNLTNKAAEESGWLGKLPGIKFAKTLITAGATSGAENSYIKMAYRDNEAVMEEFSTKVGKLFDDTVSQSTAKLAELQNQANTTNTVATKGAQDWLDKQNKVAEAAKAAAKAQEELNRKIAEQAKLAKEVLYDYGTEFTRIEADLTKELARFNEASLPSADRSRLIEEAKQISAARKQVYLLEYQQDLDAWNWSEEQKLAKTFEIEKARVDAKVGMSKEERALRKKSLDEQRDDELKSLRLSQEQQLFQIEESYMDEAKALTRRYELERQEIEKVRDAKIRAGLLNASARAEDNEYEDRRRNAYVNFQSMSSSLNGSEEYFNLDKELEDRRKVIADALKWNNITEDEARAANLAAEKKYLQDRLSLHFMYGESIAESTADTMKTVFGEQSAAYKAMFAIQKGFAIAQSMIAIQQGIANAMSLPFPANLAAAATVAAETASIIGNIKAIGLTGMAHNGIDNIPREGTWLLDGGERVLNPQQNKDLTNYLNNRQSDSGEGGVQISQQITFADGSANVNTQGQKQIAESLNNAMNDWARRESRQGGVLFNLVRR
ncbi:putative soluble lytic transglycosylase fused to an ABC-type amino acid-binding protein [Acinetobacter baumannii]|nr:putative soluble lytic transglycosylase fused to an ABC-type amino acid-binding protein [Acinetobacter baumannii]